MGAEGFDLVSRENGFEPIRILIKFTSIEFKHPSATSRNQFRFYQGFQMKVNRLTTEFCFLNQGFCRHIFVRQFFYDTP